MQYYKPIVVFLCCIINFNVSLPLSKLFSGQHKICTNNYADGQISIRSAIRQLLGIPKHHFLSKQINKWIIPTEYTGFKIMKKHSLKNGISTLSSDITLNYCQEGELLWSKDVNSDNNIDKTSLLWTEPICIYNNDKDPIVNNNDNSLNKTYTKWNQFLEWTLKKTKFMVKPKNENITLKERALNDLSNLRCYKVARNKKYALQNLNIFLPNQFIGGIFKCDLSKNQTLLQTHFDKNLKWVKNDNSTHEMIKNFCNVDNSKPLLPLIGDKFENYWSEYNGLKKNDNEMHISIVKTLPFLYTPHILGSSLQASNNSTYKNDLDIKDSDTVEWTHTLKFRILDKFRTKSKDHKDYNWYNGLSVNENYTVALTEMKNLEKITNKMLVKLQNIAHSEYFCEKNLVDDISVESVSSDGGKIKKKSLKNLPKKIMFSALSFEDKLTSILAEKFVFNQIKNLVQENDKLKLNNDYFEYKDL